MTAPARADVRVGVVDADPAVSGARFHGGQCACSDCMSYELDRWADANAAVAGSVRRAFIGGVR